MAKKGQKQKERRAAVGKKGKSSSSANTSTPASSSAAAESHRGLVNLGNTCFLNSILQCLNVSSPFSDDLVTLAKAELSSGSLGAALCGVFRGIRGQESSKGNVTPKPLLGQLRERFPWYRAGEQQDAHELLRTLLGAVSDEVTTAEKKRDKAEGKAPPRPPGAPVGCCEKTVWDNFRGHWAVAVLCWSCQKVSTRLDPFLDISLELPSTSPTPGPLGVPTAALTAAKASRSTPSRQDAAADNAEDDGEGDAEDDADTEDDEVDGGTSLSKRERKKKRKERAEAKKSKKKGDPVSKPVVEGASTTQAASTEAAAAEANQILKDQGCENLRAELDAMKPSALRKRAVAMGIDENDVEQARDADDSKAAFIKLIMAAQVSATEASHAFVTQLTDWASEATRDGAAPTNEFCLSLDGLPGQVPEEVAADAIPSEAAGEAPAAADAAGSDALAASTEGDTAAADSATADATETAAEDAESTKACKESPEEAQRFEAELTREMQSGGPVRWGFEWNESELTEGRLIVDGVLPDSCVDRWNLKRQTLGQQDRIIMKGDRLLAVNGQKTRQKMQKALKEETTASMTFAHEARLGTSDVASEEDVAAASKKGQKSKKGKAAAAEKEEDDPQAAAEARETRRRDFCEQARKCEEALPEALRRQFANAQTLTREAGKAGALADCLRQAATVEAIEDDYAPSYECVHCAKENGLQRCFASRRVWLRPPLPRLLTVQLKRFHRRGQRFEKSSVKVSTPALLDLAPFVMGEAQHSCLKSSLAPGSVFEPALASESDLQYELYGVCVHLGSTMHNGHYIAYVNVGCSLEDEKWYYVSDSHVKRCTRAEVLEAEAYVAFYRREGLCKAEQAAEEAEGETSSEAEDGNTGD